MLARDKCTLPAGASTKMHSHMYAQLTAQARAHIHARMYTTPTYTHAEPTRGHGRDPYTQPQVGMRARRQNDV